MLSMLSLVTLISIQTKDTHFIKQTVDAKLLQTTESIGSSNYRKNNKQTQKSTVIDLKNNSNSNNKVPIINNFQFEPHRINHLPGQSFLC